MKSDKQLVELSLKDDKYFAELIERYERKLSRYIYHLSSLDAPSTEDLLQEVFIKAYENLNDYDDTFSFSSWIYRITHNEVISFFRKTKARPQTINPDDVDEDYISLMPDSTDIPAEIKKKELAAEVKKHVLELPEKYRDVLVLRFLEDKSYKEISDILKKSVNSVSVLINRAKEKLKSKLTI